MSGSDHIQKILCWFGVVAGVTGLIRGICAVKNGKNRFFSVFTGGRPFFSTISAVKTVKIKNFLCLPFSPGGHPFFVYHIRGKNGKNRLDDEWPESIFHHVGTQSASYLLSVHCEVLSRVS